MYNISDNFDDLLDPMDDDKLERFVDYAQSVLEDRKATRKKEAAQKLLTAIRAYKSITGEDSILINHYPYTDADGFSDYDCYQTIEIPIDDLYVDNNNQFSLTDE